MRSWKHLRARRIGRPAVGAAARAVAETLEGRVLLSTATLLPSADAHVRNGAFAATNFGTAGELEVRLSSAADSWRESFLRFDLTGVASADQVTAATVRLHGRLSAAGSVDVGLFALSAGGAPWTEGGLTWDNRPFSGTQWVGGPAGLKTLTNTATASYEFDVTAYLKERKAAGDASVDLSIKATNYTTSHALFASDEAATNRPTLVVVQQDPPPASTTVSLRSPADAHVRGGASAAANFGAATALEVRLSPGDENNWREAFLRFDLTQVASAAQITSATVRLFGRLAAAGSLDLGLFTPNTTTWTEAGVTWNNRPFSGTQWIGNLKTLTSTADTWHDFDVTAHLKERKAAGATSVDLSLKATNHTTTHAIFKSDEATAFRPELVVVQSPPPPVGSTVSLRSPADAHVRGGTAAAANFGAATALEVRLSPGDENNWREAFLRFDLTGVASAEQVTSATVRLNGRLSAAGSVDVGLFAPFTSGAWAEDGLTWGNRPFSGTQWLGNLRTVASTADGWYEFDVTGYLKERKAAGAAGVDLSVKATNATTAHAIFASDEAAANRPALVVVQSPPLPPAAPTNLTAGTVTNSRVNLSWTDASTNETGFTIERAFDAAFTQLPTTFTAPAGATTYADTSPAAGITYHYRVRATNAAGGSANSNAVTVTTANNKSPQLVVRSPAFTLNPDGKSITAHLLGTDDGGEANLQYNWSVGVGDTPSPDLFPNFDIVGTPVAGGGRDFVIGFAGAGRYRMRAFAFDGQYYNGNSPAPVVEVTIAQNLTTIEVDPGAASLVNGQSKSFATAATDQFGHVMSAGTRTWSVDPGGLGSVSTAGLYTAPPTGVGSAVVRATVGGVSGTAVVQIGVNNPPEITGAATAVPAGGVRTAQLGVQATDDGGEPSLTYTWAVLSAPAGAPAVAFAGNGTNAGKAQTVSGLAIGSYTFRVTVTDAFGFSTPADAPGNTVTLTVPQPAPPDALFAAGVGAGRVALRWHPPAGVPAEYYRLYRGTTPGFSATVDRLVATTAADTSAYVDVGLSVGMAYYYRASAVTPFGEESVPTAAVATVAKNEDADVDNDGILNPQDDDSDNDGTPDATDTDDDNDGVLDTQDQSDTDDDNDGVPNWVDTDHGNDGVPDGQDTDNDNDGTPDVGDRDDDNDGVADDREPFDKDEDNDGVEDELDSDDDNDGTPDAGDEDDDNDGANDADDPADGNEPKGPDLSREAIINFDDLAVGTVVTNQYPLATFSNAAGYQSKVLGDWSPKVVGVYQGANYSLLQDLYVDFTVPVDKLRFDGGYQNSSGPIVEVRVFRDGAYSATVPLIGRGTGFVETVDLSGYKGVTRIEIVNITDPAGLAYDNFRFVPAAVDLVAHRTGGKFGEAVSRKIEDGGDPEQYVVLTNNDFEEELPEEKPDFDNDAANIPTGTGELDAGQDDDLAKLTLKKLPATLTTGSIELRLSSLGAARLFKADGSQLYKQGQTGTEVLTLNLSSPTGYLADLRSGDLDVYLEGLAKTPDLTVSIIYKDAGGREVSRDDVHMLLAEWKFVDDSGGKIDSVTPIWKDDLLDTSLSSMADYATPKAYQVQIGGLAPSALQNLKVESTWDGAEKYTAETAPADGGGDAGTRYSHGLYFGKDAIDKLTPEERQQVAAAQGKKESVRGDAKWRAETAKLADLHIREMKGQFRIGVEGNDLFSADALADKAIEAMKEIAPNFEFVKGKQVGNQMPIDLKEDKDDLQEAAPTNGSRADLEALIALWGSDEPPRPNNVLQPYNEGYAEAVEGLPEAGRGTLFGHLLVKQVMTRKVIIFGIQGDTQVVAGPRIAWRPAEMLEPGGSAGVTLGHEFVHVVYRLGGTLDPHLRVVARENTLRYEMSRKMRIMYLQNYIAGRQLGQVFPLINPSFR